MNDKNPHITSLEKLYAAVQGLNRALATASASGTLQAVQVINDALPGTRDFNPASLTPDEAKQARALADRIRVLQTMNRALCDGGIRTVQWFMGTVGTPNSYDDRGKRTLAALTDLNVSA